MKRANQTWAGASLAGCVDFDDFMAAGRCSGLCPSANRASDSQRHGWLAIMQPAQARWRASLRNRRPGSIPRLAFPASSIVYACAWRIVAHAASDRANARETEGDSSAASRCKSMIWERMRFSLPTRKRPNWTLALPVDCVSPPSWHFVQGGMERKSLSRCKKVLLLRLKVLNLLCSCRGSGIRTSHEDLSH
jgi:hypothetical protein